MSAAPADAIDQRPVLRRWMERAEQFGTGEWVLLGLAGNLLLLLLVQLLIWLWPSERQGPLEINAASELSFVEYEEVKNREPVKTKDLSDQIIEKEKIEDEKINWENAVDPTFDTTQRYRPIFDITVNEDNYPERARRSNLPTVTVNFTMLVSSNGKILDVSIQSIRSPGNAHKVFEADFKKSLRQIILHQTKLITRPYTSGGTPTNFVWKRTMHFRLK